jgi:hypothetical protein
MSGVVHEPVHALRPRTTEGPAGRHIDLTVTAARSPLERILDEAGTEDDHDTMTAPARCGGT